MYVTEGKNAVIKSWIPFEEIEDVAREQLLLITELPILFRHVAVMPDAHYGKGTTVGTVFASRDAFVPTAVGVDIGCGMLAAKYNDLRDALLEMSEDEKKDALRRLHKEILRLVPVGVGQDHKEPQREAMSKFFNDVDDRIGGIWPVTKLALTYLSPDDRQKLEVKAHTQIGTLGSGNHFIELQHDEEGNVWVMIHSGSRWAGATIGSTYMRKAKELNELWHTGAPRDLDFLPIGSGVGDDYFNDMLWATTYAEHNRIHMLRLIETAIQNTFSIEAAQADFVHIPHNYADIETHFGENVWVHRKGATPAREGSLGIVPGSMGTSSYIVRGKGERESFMSCSHGAGRRMSRGAARRELSPESMREQVRGVGSYAFGLSDRMLEEAPDAYKDIDHVMESQRDLVEVVHTMRPIFTVKGN